MQAQRHYTPEEARLAVFLQMTAALCTLIAIVLFLLPFLAVPPIEVPPFFVTNTTAGFGLLAFVAWVTAADVRRYRPFAYALLVMLLAGSAIYWLASLSPASLPSDPIVVSAGIVLLAAGLLLGLLIYEARPQAPAWLPWLPDQPLGTWERIGQIVLGFMCVGSIAGALFNIALPFIDPTSPFLSQSFFVAGSAVKIAALALLAGLAAWDVRRFVHHVQSMTAFIVGNTFSGSIVIVYSLLALPRFADFTLVLGDTALGVPVQMLAAILIDGSVVGTLFFIQHQMNRETLDSLGFFTPTQFRALEAIAESLIAGGEAEVENPHETVLRTDAYLASFQSNRLFLARLAVIGLELFPLIWLLPPITYLRPTQRQRFIDQHFKEEIITPTVIYRLLDGIVLAVNALLLLIRRRSLKELGATLSFTGLLEGMLRFNMQLVYLGYYSSPTVWRDSIGYIPFSEREKDFEVVPLRPHPPLDVITPTVLEQREQYTIDDADVVIIGSGATGAILAEQLADKGRRVLLLEKGGYVHPDDFSEDEVDMISRLYRDGALQISQSLRFTILQGSCIGGTTVINNAVCFDTPESVIDRWNADGPVIDKTRYYESQAAVRQRMRIRKVQAGTRTPLDGGVLNHGDAAVLDAAVQAHFAAQADAYEYDVVQANITDCLGCGYCNIGCKYGRKLSMLDEVLPSAQHKHGAENFRIISEAEVQRLKTSGGRVTEVLARIGGRHNLHIRNPKTVIVSAGTIASSWLLMQSGIGKGKLPVGRRLSFNMGSPLHGWFDRKLNSYDGLQIAHYLKLKNHDGFVFETWYNPPVAQALAMPGWLETHFVNMQKYDEMAAVGVLVGTESNAYITPALLTRGPDVVYQPSGSDLQKLVTALTILGEIMLAGGAKEVYASTRKYQPYRNAAAVFSAQSQLGGLADLVRGDADILLGTGHPQGGNAIGLSPGTDGETGAVIGPDFKVFGYDNLYICDASVFPTSTTVNPQLTVMTMAHYAAQLVEG